MIFDLEEPILDYDGQKLLARKPTGEETVIGWKEIIFNALNGIIRDEVLTAEDKVKCYQITGKAYKGKKLDLSLEEAVFVLRRIEKIYTSPLICGRAREFFEKK